MQIQTAIAQANEHLAALKDEYEETENSILNPDTASRDRLQELLSIFKHQKKQLQETRKSIAKLYKDGVQVFKQ